MPESSNIPRKSMRIAVVVQRYGPEIVGGAEKLARDMSIAMHTRLNWNVEVYTTTAKDYITWKNEYPAGTHMIDGIPVHRFDVIFPRVLRVFNVYHHFVCKLLTLRNRFPKYRKIFSLLILFAEPLWYLLQGPYSWSLNTALRKACKKQQYDLLFLVTYLYKPVIDAARIRGIPKLLVSNFHDEAAANFFTTKRLFRRVDRVLANTEIEKTLIQRFVPHIDIPMDVVGVGIQELSPENVSDANRTKVSNYGRYILYLGRIDEQKGCVRLMKLFSEYCQQRNISDLTLILAGSKEPGVLIPKQKNIQYLGFVSEQEKEALILHAQCVVNLSRYESFSFLILEALMVNIPCIVNSHCEVLQEYTRHAPICFGIFEDRDFSKVLDECLDLSHQKREKNTKTIGNFHKSQSWVKNNYSWNAVMQRLETSCQELFETKAREK